MSEITYTPNGIPRQPGYYDPNNPYDTGRTGERNAELGGGGKNTMSGWDYDAGRPKDGAYKDEAGNWTIGGGGGGGGGGMSSLFANPYYQQYQSQLQAQQAADLSDTKSQLQQLLIQFGMVPTGFKDSYGAIDDTIRNLIEQNTASGISQYARMMEGKDDVRRESLNRLGSRGLSRSGARGYRLRRNSLDFDRQFSDTLNSVLGNANALQSGYAGRELQRQQNLSQMLAQLSQQWSPVPTGGSPFQPQGVPQPQMYQSKAGMSPYKPVQDGTYTGGALYATKTENDKINPIFWMK